MSLSVIQIREAIEEQLKLVRGGNADLKISKEVRSLSSEYLKSVKLEMDYYRSMGQKPPISVFLPSQQELAEGDTGNDKQSK